MSVEQYDQEYDMLSHFALEMGKIKPDRADKFVGGLKLELQGFVQAFRPATQADALHLLARPKTWRDVSRSHSPLEQPQLTHNMES